MYRLALIPGDGIGPEVTKAILHLLEALDIEFDYTLAYAGDACFKETGTTIPDETLSNSKKSRCNTFWSRNNCSGT